MFKINSVHERVRGRLQGTAYLQRRPKEHPSLSHRATIILRRFRNTVITFVSIGVC